MTVKNELDKKHMNLVPDDGRSDDKGSEPESVVVAKMGSKHIICRFRKN
jgi:hypothetical protein